MSTDPYKPQPLQDAMIDALVRACLDNPLSCPKKIRKAAKRVTARRAKSLSYEQRLKTLRATVVQSLAEDQSGKIWSAIKKARGD
jgi:hypothetical protein